MSSLSNKFGLPQAIVNAVEADPYSKGASDYSVTGLLKPPQIAQLSLRHDSEIVEDVSDRLWSLYGQIVHGILERANQLDLAEKRFFADFEVGGKIYVVSAQIDTLSLVGKILTDYKFVTSWKFKYGKPTDPDWTAQVNMQLEILRRNGIDAETLQIVGLLRDHSKLEALRSEDYPKQAIVRSPLEMWERRRTSSFIEERIILHESAKDLPDDKLPPCSASERYSDPDKWAVMKGARAINFGVKNSEADARQTHLKNPGTRIEFRAGQSKRCLAYCSAAPFCKQNPYRKGTP